MKDESRPGKGGPATNTTGTILNLPHVEQRVIDEARAIATARASKIARLEALGLEQPSTRFECELHRRLVQWDTMLVAHGRRAA